MFTVLYYFGAMFYLLTDGNEEGHFGINETTGQISIVKRFEAADVYQLRVQAADQKVNPSTATTLVRPAYDSLCYR